MIMTLVFTKFWANIYESPGLCCSILKSLFVVQVNCLGAYFLSCQQIYEVWLCKYIHYKIITLFNTLFNPLQWGVTLQKTCLPCQRGTLFGGALYPRCTSCYPAETINQVSTDNLKDVLLHSMLQFTSAYSRQRTTKNDKERLVLCKICGW